MKNNRIQYILLGIAAMSIFTTCKQKAEPKTAPVSIVKSKSYYTCSMHPQIHEEHPGDCPICSMKLIKVESAGSMDNMNMNSITLTKAQIALAGIRTYTVREENIGNQKTLTGTVTTDENKAEVISARIAGRLQQLFVRTTGEKIFAGQAIFTIYSEDLLEAEKEYLLARQQQKQLNNPDVDYASLIAAAENKLTLWGLTRSQIKTLSSSGKTSATVQITSKVSGTVSDIMVHEGDYVTEGMSVMKTQALNSLWIEAQLYANEVGNYKEKDAVSISLPDLGGQQVNGKVEFINPELSDASKVALIRVSVPNPQGLIRPGMLAYISISSENKYALAVPASSVLLDGKGAKVWVKNNDGSFSPRSVKTGDGNQNYITVYSGLSPGDIVVTNGAYLLNSEAYFKNGGEQMSMGGMRM